MPTPSPSPDAEQVVPESPAGPPTRRRLQLLAALAVVVCLVTWLGVDALTGGSGSGSDGTGASGPPTGGTAVPREGVQPDQAGTTQQVPAVIPPTETGPTGFLAALREVRGSEISDEDLLGLGRQTCVVLQSGGSVGSAESAAIGTGRIDQKAAGVLVGASQDFLCTGYRPPVATTFAADGTYRAGSDIEPGTYRAAGGEGCRWARLRGAQPSLGNTIEDGAGAGQHSVVVRRDEYLSSTGCGEWRRTG